MQKKNAFDQFDGAPGQVLFAPQDPFKAPKAAADVALAQAEADPVLLKAKRDKAVADAAKAQADAASAGASDLDPATLSAISAGKRIKLTDLPPGSRGIVAGLLQGNLPAGQRSIASKAMLPYIKMAMSVDPTFSANTFSARQKATSQLADMKATGGYLTSLAANIDHSREEEKAINDLGNPGGVWGRWGGAALNNWLFNKGGPAGAQFDQANRVYSGEQVKSITGNVGTAGGGSALQDRQEAQDAITASMPIDAQRAALRTGAVQNYQKWQDANASYRRTMGTDIPDALSREQAAQLLHLMRLQGDGTEGPIPEGIDPGFVALATGSGSGGGGATGGGIPPVSGGIPPISGGGRTPPGGGGPSGPTGPQNPLNFAQGQYGDATNTEVAGATKSIPNELGIQFMKGLNSLFHAGASDERVRAYASQFGIDPSPQLDYRRKNPGFRGSIPVTPGGLSITVPNDSVTSRIAGAMAGSPTGTFVGEAGNAAAAGIPQWAVAGLSDNPDLVRARFGVARAMNPGAAISGQLVGGTLGAIGGETGALRGAGAIGKAFKLGEGAQDALNFGGRRLADAAFGGTSGFTSAEPGQGGSGAIKGALAGTFGGLLGEGAGRYAIEPTTRPIGRLFGAPEAPGPADNALFKAVGNNGPDINAQLGEARGLNLPMTLADTNPALRSLAGAAVRRSPNASGIAENVLLPRNRGQIDRLASAVSRDLGPIENIPQLQDNLIKGARAKAGPLYDQAYAAPVVATPELAANLETPFGRQALGRARTIAANERRSPTELGITLDANGNPVLNPQPNAQMAAHLGARADLDAAQAQLKAARTDPSINVDKAKADLSAARERLRKTEAALAAAPDPSAIASTPGYSTQTLDYVKRGMDDVLEQYRNPITGRLQLDEAGRAQNGVRANFLSEIDKLNPAYAQARAAYAGPAAERDFINMGRDAFSADPNQLKFNMRNVPQDKMPMVQLGHRDALIQRANSARFGSNPYDATLGTPAAEVRLQTVYPEGDGPSNLLRQRDLERQMQATSNDILGNSKTAQRGIADEAFAGEDLPQLALDTGLNLMTGQVPIGTMVKAGMGQSMRDAIKFGVGKRAVKKADILAPTLLNPDPAASSAELADILARSQGYRDYLARRRGMFGAPLGAVGAGSLSGYLGSQ